MNTEVIIALISLCGTLLTVAGTLVGVKIQNSKHYALIDYRLIQIEKNQEKYSEHNDKIEDRVYNLEKKVDVLETKIERR